MRTSVHLLACGVRGLKVRLEKLPLIFIADSYPKIDHLNCYLKVNTTIFSLRFYVDGLVNWGELNRVGEQINQDLLHSHFVHHQIYFSAFWMEVNLDIS